MDVNVRDVEEIVRFGHSLKGFLSDYLSMLGRVGSAAQQDYTTARNNLQRIRGNAESAERDLRQAERQLDSAYRTANNNPEEDHSDRIDYLERLVEEKQERYERNKEALAEAEQLTKRVKVNTDMVWEQTNRSRNQINELGHTALSSIQKAANAIKNYIR